MKKAKILLVAALMALCGCKGDEVPETEQEGGNNENPPVQEVDPKIANSKWGYMAAQECFDTIGTVIPYLEADAFEFEKTVDDYGDPAIWFYLYYETSEIAESKIEEYANAAYAQDQYACVAGPERFTDPATYSYWEQMVLHANKNLSDTKAVEIMALDSIRNYKGEGKPCLGLFCFNYIPNVNPNKFPTYPVNTLLGDNLVPTLDTLEGTLTYSFSFILYEGVKCLEIVVTSDDYYFELEEILFKALLSNGYTIAQFDELENDYTDNVYHRKDTYPGFEDSIYYYAYSPIGDHILCFDYNLSNSLLIIDIFPITNTPGVEE